MTWQIPENLPTLSGTVALDLETRDTKLKERGPGWCFKDNGDYIAGIGLAGEWGKTYLPIRHQGGGNLPAENVLRYLADKLSDPSLTVVTHNGMYDRGWLAAEGVKTKCKWLDTMTAGPLINEYRRSYSLDNMSFDYLGRRKNTTELDAALARFKWGKGDLWRLPSTDVGLYGEGDAGDTLDLWNVLKPLLDKDELWGVFNLEMQLQPILIAMRMRGVRVDFDKAEQASRDLEFKEIEAQKRLNEIAGYTVDVWSGESIAKLFDAAGVPYPRTPKTDKPSFKGDWLEEHPSEVAGFIKSVRRFNKARNTFIQGYVLDKAVNGRIHCQFNPLPKGDQGGAVTGRFSSSDPNLQNLPNPERDEYIGKLVRELYLPEEGEEWISADYSQQEPRLAVHYAGVLNCRGAAEAVNAFVNDPNTDFHQLVSDITSLTRKKSKIMNLALMYGRGGASTAHALGLPTKFVWSNRWNKMIEVAGPEAQEIIDTYHEKLPFVRALDEECKRRASRKGFIKTLSGRRARFFRKWDESTTGWAYPYKAMNRLIQGGSADQIKMSMVAMYEEGILPLVSVHDENGLSGDKELANRVSHIMRHCVELRVPSKVDIAIGPSWGEAA